MNRDVHGLPIKPRATAKPTVNSQAVECPYCHKQATLTDSAVVYSRSYGPIYLCRPCRAWVGCHKGTTNPLGRLANAELRKAKQAAHAAFDPLWRNAPKDKTDRWGAYVWLAEQLGIELNQAHIGMFDLDLCRRTVEICNTVPFTSRKNRPGIDALAALQEPEVQP